jgi:hypothetical protein
VRCRRRGAHPIGHPGIPRSVRGFDVRDHRFGDTALCDPIVADVVNQRRLACLEGEQAAVEYWQVKRGGGFRGIIEIIGEKP